MIRSVWVGCWLLGMSLLMPVSLWAMDYQATQGDVVRVEYHGELPPKGLQALGQQWPLRQHQGSWQGWIGVDLKTRPGNHVITWQTAGGKQQDRLHVQAGEFRISRIEVKKAMASFDAESLARIRKDQKALKQTYQMDSGKAATFSYAALPVEGVMSTPFGAQRYVNGEPRSPHSGIDIAAAEGTPVATPFAGTVLLVSSMYLNGNTVVIGHGDGLVSVFSHLHDMAVKQGDVLAAGAVIGAVGMSGRATGPHLHWSIRFHEARINPFALQESVQP